MCSDRIWLAICLAVTGNYVCHKNRKTAYGTQNENSANRHAVDFQLWNIDRNAGADNVIRKIDEKIDINGIV